jgi:outer membrane receptor protein involved in Fe transport
VLVRAQTKSDYKEVAAFGNLTLYLSDSFDVTGGLRFARNTQVAQTGGPNAVSFYAPRASADFRFEDDVTTYLANVRYRPSRNVTLFARAASGYRPGGPQNNPAPPPGSQTVIRPDTVWNYEAGIKASTPDGKATINASAYQIDWKDIQLNTTFNGVVLQANGGKARIQGFELDFALRPTRLLSVGTTMGYTDARLTQVDAGVQTNVGAAPGDRLPLTPKWTVAMIADQRVPFAEGVEGRLGATLRFRSDMPSNYPGALLNRNVKIPSLTTLDLRAGVDFGRFGVQLRADNVLNEFGYTSLSSDRLFVGQPIPTVGSVIRPRSYTLALTADF